MTSPANLYSRDMRVLPSYVERQVHPSVVSKAKRTLDIFGAVIGLIITGLVAIPIAIAMYFDDPGKLFYIVKPAAVLMKNLSRFGNFAR